MNFQEMRRLFPVTKKLVYLNHAGVSPISKPVKAAVDRFVKGYLDRGFTAAREWHAEEKEARGNAARLIGAQPDEIAFVANTSHGLSLVAAGLDWRAGDNLLVPDCEFPANLYPWLSLKKKGVEARLIPSRAGRPNVEELKRMADRRTRLLAISSVQYGSGWRAPLEELGAWCRSRGILFCVDGIQSLGAIEMDVEKFRIDFLAADGHKWLLGPEGTGFFYCSGRAESQIAPSHFGWNSVADPLDFDHPHFDRPRRDAKKFEPGSNNLLGIHALNAALGLLLSIGIAQIQARLFELGDRLVAELLRGWPQARVVSPLSPAERSGIIAVETPGDPQALAAWLLEKGVFVSSRRGWLRFSPHAYNTPQELKLAVQTAAEIG